MSRRDRLGRDRRGGLSVGASSANPLASSPIGLWAGTITTGATFTWADLSGNGNDLVQATAGAQPTKNAASANFNGQPSISLSGAQGLGTAGNITLGTQFEFLFVISLISGGTNRIVWETSVAGAGTNVGSIVIGYNWTNPPSSGYNLLIHGSVGNNWQAVNAPAGNAIVTVAADITASPDTEVFRYGNSPQSVASNAGLSDNSAGMLPFQLFFGSRAGAGGVGPITCECPFAAVWTRLRTESERASHQAFLHTLYGV